MARFPAYSSYPPDADTGAGAARDGDVFYDPVTVTTTPLINPDSDGDGMLDTFELANGFDPLNTDEDLDGIIDGQVDFDADGLGNAAEAEIGTNPNLADTDGDGLLDGQEIGTGVFGPQQIITTLADAAISVFGADVDGDGDVDVLSASEFDDKIAWYKNTDGLGSFGPQQVISTLADGANSVFAVDVDGDGDIDVLSASIFDDKIAWYENTDGLGSFGPQQVITTLADFAKSVFGVDLDGDGDTDVLSASNDDSKIAWYQNTDGLGTFGPQQVIATPLGADSVFGTDMDGDGDIDVLVAAGFKIVWYENTNGLGNFGPERVITTLVSIGTSVYGVDIDRDGDIDVFSAAIGDNTIAWYQNTDGLGNFGPQQVITTLAHGATSVFGTDVDGDGDADVLVSSSGDNTIAWYENTDGLGSFGPKQVLTAQADRAESVFGTDLDGDGDTDIVHPTVGTDTIAWFEQTNVSDPLVSDTDGDGLLDGFEVNNGFDPLVPGEQSLDPDGDGLDNLAEQAAGADPLNSDTDGDGLLDGAEVNLHGTDPTNADTDGDGVDDGVEIAAGTNPLDPLSFPGFVIDFDAGVGIPITYSEQGVTFTSVQSATSHLHLGNNRGDPSPDLLNHSGCCSTPYEITSIGDFCLLSLEVVGGTNPGTFTSDTATAVVVPNTLGTFDFPVDFCGTKFTWEQAVGDLAIDDLRAIDFATPAVPTLGSHGLAVLAALISGLGISALSMRRRRPSR